MKYIVSGKERPNKHLICSMHSDMDSFILCNDLCLEEDSKNMDNISDQNESEL